MEEHNTIGGGYSSNICGDCGECEMCLRLQSLTDACKKFKESNFYTGHIMFHINKLPIEHRQDMEDTIGMVIRYFTSISIKD